MENGKTRLDVRVYGKDGHRQRQSFGESFKVEPYGSDGYILVKCEDVTGTNDYVELSFVFDTIKECVRHLESQLLDGIFECSNYDKITLVNLVMPRPYVKKDTYMHGA